MSFVFICSLDIQIQISWVKSCLLWWCILYLGAPSRDTFIPPGANPDHIISSCEQLLTNMSRTRKPTTWSRHKMILCLFLEQLRWWKPEKTLSNKKRPELASILDFSCFYIQTSPRRGKAESGVTLNRIENVRSRNINLWSLYFLSFYFVTDPNQNVLKCDSINGKWTSYESLGGVW